MKFICWQNKKKVKVSIVLSQTQTRQKRGDIFLKINKQCIKFLSYVQFYEILVEK